MRWVDAQSWLDAVTTALGTAAHTSIHRAPRSPWARWPNSGTPARSTFVRERAVLPKHAERPRVAALGALYRTSAADGHAEAEGPQDDSAEVRSESNRRVAGLSAPLSDLFPLCPTARPAGQHREAVGS
jgi:hypothetical protein